MEIKDVENLAKLARIELTENEKKDLLRDMEGILGYVRQIEAIQIPETEAEYDIENVWREDATDSRDFSPELIVGQFPDAKEGFLRVKKILP